MIIGSRMTRSQSREANEPSKVLKAPSKLGRKRLSGLAEEPATSPGFVVPKQVVPESPGNHEGHTNVSGTTLGHNDPEYVDSQVGVKIVDHLPFIQEQATLVMNLLVPQDMNPDSIAAEAKRFRDSVHPNTKRLRRSVEGMVDELNDSPLSLNGMTFLDISRVRRLVTPTQFEASIPNLHMTNCASLALNFFFSADGASPQPQIIQELDANFPLCIMNNVTESLTSREIGSSNTRDTTFNLALNIRTQFFIMELERRQREQNFNPIAILRQIFCMDLTPSEDHLEEIPGSFRGFNLPGVFQDEDGHLPETLPDKLQIAVSDRFNELYEEISEWEDLDVAGLKKAYRWRSFERDLARWIHTRSREIKEDIRRLSEKQAQQSPAIRRFTPAPVGTPSLRQTSAVSPSAERPRGQPVQHAWSPQQDRLLDEALRNGSPQLANSPPKVTATVASNQAKTKDPARRKSKGNYRDASSLAAFKKRMDTSRQQSLANPTSQPRPSASKPREIVESPDQTYLETEDEPTYVNNDEELDLDQDHEGLVMASTSPSVSARINRVSHNPNRYFHSPEGRSLRRSIEGSSGANEKSNAARRYFIEKQNNAGKVSPISYTDTQSAEKRRDMPPLTNTKKRANPFNNTSSGSDDESDDFEQDSRHASRRPEKRPRVPGSASDDRARQQLQLSLNEARQTDQEPSISSRLNRAQREEDSEEITDGEASNPQLPQVAPSLPPPASAMGSHWAKVNARSAAANLSGRKATHRWDEAEDERLLALMAQFGTSYATIKREDNAFPASEGGPLLDRRSQVQCKDRARNLKKKYIRDGRKVPAYMDKIVI